MAIVEDGRFGGAPASSNLPVLVEPEPSSEHQLRPGPEPPERFLGRGGPTSLFEDTPCGAGVTGQVNIMDKGQSSPLKT